MSPASPVPPPADPPPAEPAWAAPPEELLTYNAKLGLVLFAIYTAMYANFVFVSAFRVEWMGVLWNGVPISVWSGFGLIAAAALLAGLYGVLARDAVEDLGAGTSDGGCENSA